MTVGPFISDHTHSDYGRARSSVMYDYIEDLCTPIGVIRSDVEPMLDCLAGKNPQEKISHLYRAPYAFQPRPFSLIS